MSNKGKALFIKTQDFETHESLLESGLKLVDYTNGTWTFVNDPERPLIFEDKKITYSDMLCI